MTPALCYLEAAKVEELADELQRKGFEIATDPKGLSGGYNLLATRAGRTTAYKVIAGPHLRESAADIRGLSRRSRDWGYDEFRLVVVNPPRAVSITVQGLDAELFRKLEENLPEELAVLGPHVRLMDVSDLQFDSVAITPEGTRVSGSGHLDASFSGEGKPDGLTWETDLLFSFDLRLDHDGRIAEVIELDVDTTYLDSPSGRPVPSGNEAS